jgi:hypothetical protein
MKNSLLPITPERLAGVYEMLRAFPPFAGWKLPPAADVRFHVLKTDKWQADWWMDGMTHHIRVSEKKHGHLESLIESMAHEMIHVRQRIAKTETNGDHNEEFKRLAKRVCSSLGFDYGQFS